MKHSVIKFIIVLSFIIMIIVLNMTSSNDACHLQNYMIGVASEGEIKRVYWDKSNHNTPSILIEGKEGTSVIALIGDTTKLFDYLHEGDWIKKESGSLRVLIRRNGSEQEWEVGYHCGQKE